MSRKFMEIAIGIFFLVVSCLVIYNGIAAHKVLGNLNKVIIQQVK
ncbi:MAG: hypothetical protein PHV30_06385 [Candidatus Margulisbacteria bacterium]|nr:hypothetical protein [Candidatus Margulisiibacteriota bacterium]